MSSLRRWAGSGGGVAVQRRAGGVAQSRGGRAVCRVRKVASEGGGDGSDAWCATRGGSGTQGAVSQRRRGQNGGKGGAPVSAVKGEEEDCGRGCLVIFQNPMDLTEKQNFLLI